MKNILSIAFGAVFGTWLRYLLHIATSPLSFPAGTLFENVSGSFLLGFLTGFFVRKGTKEWLKLGLGVGLYGGFTTFSTFIFDSALLWSDGYLLKTIIYISLTFIGGLIFVVAGFVLGQRVGGCSQKRKGNR